jgi:chromosome segregation ATPase
MAETTKGVEAVDSTIQKMRDDLKVRRKRWKNFRKHIATMTNHTFGEMLNKKGSTGHVDFDHKNKSLGLTVQKDSNEASQTSDVKALSGGERSFTTLSLLLALGENLETPFRVMDEFDVFLDAVSRKIALTTLVEVASAMVHRQFIFITPQDLSRLTPGPGLKIIKMRAPDRGGGVQTTLG